MNQVQYFFLTGLLHCTGYKMLRQKLPCLFHGFEEIFYILTYGALVLFIRLCKYQTQRNLPGFKLLKKFKVYFLGTMPGIYQYKNKRKVFPFSEIIFNHLFPSSAAS